MTPGEARPAIRVADPSESDLLREIEGSADAMFAAIGIGPFTTFQEDDHVSGAAVVLATGRPAHGFASVVIVDGVAHLWQLSVLPSFGRRGIGTSLVQAVCQWASSNGYPAVTLTTFRDVPWNAPFYSRLGFRELDELTPGLHAIREHEREIGEDDLGPRVAMRKDLRGRDVAGGAIRLRAPARNPARCSEAPRSDHRTAGTAPARHGLR